MSFPVSFIPNRDFLFFPFQVGPYTFREEHEKTNITFQPEDYTVQYRQKKFWYFDAEKSKGSLDDEIYTLNMIAVAASDATRYPGVTKLYSRSCPFFNFSSNMHEIQNGTKCMKSDDDQFIVHQGHFSDVDYPFMRAMMDQALKLCNETMFMKVR